MAQLGKESINHRRSQDAHDFYGGATEITAQVGESVDRCDGNILK